MERISMIADGAEKQGVWLVYRLLIVIGVFFTPFASLQLDGMPSYLKMWFSYAEKLSLYPLLLFSIIWIITEIKSGHFEDYLPLLILYFVYFLVNIVIVAHGIAVFPDFSQIDYTSLSGGDKIAFNFVGILFPQLEEKQVFIFSHLLKNCLTITTDFYCSFFVWFSIFLFYWHTRLDILYDLWVGVSAIMPLLLVYEIFEIGYFLGFEWGRDFLAFFNPFLYEIESTHGWWPPLFPSGIRSVFQEQSFYSYWAGVICLPVFLCNIRIQRHRFMNSIELLFVASTVFSSKASTGTALILGVVLVFVILEVMKEKRDALRTVLHVLAIILFAFVISLVLVWSFASVASGYVVNFNDVRQGFMYDTLGSLKPSYDNPNQSRFDMMKAQFEIFKDYPVLGVSRQLSGEHIASKFQEIGTAEVTNWIETQEASSGIGNTFPTLCEYTYTLATTGILGFLVSDFLFIGLTVLACCSFFFRRNRSALTMFGICSSAAVIAFGLSNTWDVNFAFIFVYPVLLLSLEGKVER